MADFPEPLAISTPGVLATRYLPVDLPDDADFLTDVDATCDISGVTVVAGVSDVDAIWNGENFDATRVIKFSVTAAADLREADGKIFFTYSSTLLENLVVDKDLFVRNSVPIDTAVRPLN